MDSSKEQNPPPKWVLFLGMLCFCFESQVEARQDLIPGSRYTSARAAAMGDAYLPLGDDIPSGLFYNPADLGRIKKAEIEPINISGYVDTSAILMAGSSFYQAGSLSSYLPTLQKTPNQMSGLGGALLPNFGFPGFGLGVLVQSQVAGQANPDGTVTYQSLYQVIPALGFGFHFLNKMVRFGYSLQWVNQAVGNRTVLASDSIGYNQFLSQGSGFSHNFGLSMTLPIRNLPALNFVVRNAMNTNYSSYSLVPLTHDPSGVPNSDPMTVDASFSLQPRLGGGTVMHLVLVNRDMTNRSGAAYLQHFALGTELDFKGRVFLRGGWGGGYPSAGLGLRRPGAEMSFTWYTEQIGTVDAPIPDSKFMLQYQIRTF